MLSTIIKYHLLNKNINIQIGDNLEQAEFNTISSMKILYDISEFEIIFSLVSTCCLILLVL